MIPLDCSSCFIPIFCNSSFWWIRSIRANNCFLVGSTALGLYMCCMIAKFFRRLSSCPIKVHHRKSVFPSETPYRIIRCAFFIKPSQLSCLRFFIARLDSILISRSLTFSFPLRISFAICVSLSTPIIIASSKLPWTWIILCNTRLLPKVFSTREVLVSIVNNFSKVLV